MRWFLKTELEVSRAEVNYFIAPIDTMILTGSHSRVTFKSYDGLAHAISEQETSDLAEWLASTLS